MSLIATNSKIVPLEFKREIPYKFEKLTDPDDTTSVSEDDLSWLYCASCGAPITHPLTKIAKQGKHAHTFYNAAGIVFHLGCFDQAENCVLQGMPTFKDTWFMGYTWRLANCARCGTQLGWQFTGEDVFYGLILSRLRSIPN